jgi:hypothetical protein
MACSQQRQPCFQRASVSALGPYTEPHTFFRTNGKLHMQMAYDQGRGRDSLRNTRGSDDQRVERGWGNFSPLVPDDRDDESSRRGDKPDETRASAVPRGAPRKARGLSGEGQRRDDRDYEGYKGEFNRRSSPVNNNPREDYGGERGRFGGGGGYRGERERLRNVRGQFGGEIQGTRNSGGAYGGERSADAVNFQDRNRLGNGQTFRVVDIAASYRPKRTSPPPGQQVGSGVGGDTGSGAGGGEGEGIRINKCFKDFTSRREADRLVQDGRVLVNGELALIGTKVFAGDEVTLDGKAVDWQQLAIVDTRVEAEEQFRYIKYWKPRGVVCTTDERVRNNIIEAVGYPARIFPVGRLDKDSSGLILLTSDGRLPNAVLRRYSVYLLYWCKSTSTDAPLLQRLPA